MTSINDPTAGAGADPDTIRVLASRLRQVATTAGQLQAEIGSTSATWTGAAATGFEARLHELPAELSTISSSFQEASNALLTWAGDVEQLQHEAHTSLAAYSTATSQLWTVQHAPSPQHGAAPSGSALAAEHEAESEAHNAQASLGRVGSDYASRARACKARIDAAAPRGQRSTFGALTLRALHIWENESGLRGAYHVATALAPRVVGLVRHDAYAARNLGHELWKESSSSAIRYKSGIEQGLEGLSTDGERFVAKGGAWGEKLGRSVEHVAKGSLKVIDDAHWAKAGLRIGGRVIAAAGVAVSAYQTGENLPKGHLVDAAVDAVQVAAFGVLAVGVVAAAPVEGAVAAGVVVATVATTAYQNRGAITATALGVGDAAVGGVDRVRGDDQGVVSADARTKKRMSEAWTAFSSE